MVDRIDTISAVATAPGEGGIGIIRVSGPEALLIAGKLFIPSGSKKIADIASHTVTFGHFIKPADGSVIDEGLLILMKEPRSYTCEDVVEFQCHGSGVALRELLSATLAEGARLAEPGEFTKRAFLNGRLDLSQAQAVIDIIRSKTDVALKSAVNHLSGDLSKKVNDYRKVILELIAHIEALIDFPEEDIELLTVDDMRRRINELIADLDGLLASAKFGRILRDGLSTVIVGQPNVGKSSLLNALISENRAIVTDIPGTTRDIIEEYINIDGIPLKIVDTAGIRETDDFVEKIGVDKARKYANQADLILLLLDAAKELDDNDKRLLSMIKGRPAIIVLNKCDLSVKLDMGKLLQELTPFTCLRVSALKRQGIDDLKAAIVELAGGNMASYQQIYINNVRDFEILRQSKDHLEEVLLTIDSEIGIDFMAIDLRSAWEKLGEITGDTVSDDIIGQIFSQFCIGK